LPQTNTAHEEKQSESKLISFGYLGMIANVNGIVVVARKIGPFLVNFRKRNAAAENALAGPGRVDIFERVGNGVRVGIVVLVADGIGFEIELE
jgi:hypothetical protein